MRDPVVRSVDIGGILDHQWSLFKRSFHNAKFYIFYRITSNVLRSSSWLGKSLRNIHVTDDYEYVPFVLVKIPSSFYISRLITGLTRRMPLVEQELLTRQEHVFLCCPLFSFLYSDLWIIVCPFARFLLTIALSFLRFTGSDYPSRIFWPLHCLSFDLRVLIAPLVSSNFFLKQTSTSSRKRLMSPWWAKP